MRAVLTLNRPPTIELLMADPVFAKMMKTRPQVPDNLTTPTLSPMWHVWVYTTSETWKRARFDLYDDAWRLFRKKMRDESVQDVTITNVRMFTPPPVGFRWQHRKYPWCARCRRPSLFLHRYSHRALRGSVTTYDEPLRCFYCGIRKVALPNHSPR